MMCIFSNLIQLLPGAAIVMAVLFGASGCSYLDSAFKQAYLADRYRREPQQRLYKHMLPAENYFVFGKIGSGSGLNEEAIAVVAIYDSRSQGEVVDVSHFVKSDAFYGLNLPAGDYLLLVVSDQNQDGFYDIGETVGSRFLTLDSAQWPEKVVGEFDIELFNQGVQPVGRSLHLEVKQRQTLRDSLFYPKGSIRSLDDEIFSQRMASLGMYEPAAFLEEAPMMFYALEEDVGYKVPVVFVHGIDGSARDFADIVRHLDRRRYRPLFFHYPSGNDLNQLGEMFHQIFLSGKTFFLGEMPMVIVAHSMGGLVVREALNRLQGEAGENQVACFVSLASPMGGHPAAAMADQGPVVIPSWRDVNPGSEFMANLRRRPLPPKLEYHLFYAYANQQAIKLGENSDGVVPLSSQLCKAAQDESTGQFGFNTTHTGILEDPEAIRRLFDIVEKVKAPFPDDHMAELLKGGYDVTLSPDYPPIGAHCIRYVGHWLEALADGRIAPLDPVQSHFVEVCQGKAEADTPIEEAWLRFIRELPQQNIPGEQRHNSFP